jgi:hypothetical protein
MTAKRAGFKRRFRLSLSSLLPLVLAVSTLSAISVPFANAASVTATGTNPSVCNQEVGNSTNVESSRVGNTKVNFEVVPASSRTTLNILSVKS